MQDKIRLQSTATEKYYDQIFEEMEELEEKKSKEALLFVQKKHIVMRYQSESDKARTLQRSGSSRDKTRDGYTGPYFLRVMQVICGG